MSTLADLHRAVQTTLASKRLGEPVFVRYLLQSKEEGELVLSRLAVATSVIGHWLGDALDRLHAAGAVQNGQVSLTLQFRNGGTALVSFARGGNLEPVLDLMVLGNHGAIYFRPEDERPPALGKVVDQLPDAALLDLIERALKSGKPEAIGGRP